MEIKEAYPLQWPVGWKRTRNPKQSRFGSWNSKPTIHQSTQSLLDELQRLTRSRKCIITTNLKLRMDGLPYSSQRQPDDQGVAVYFKYNNDNIVIACDTYDKIGCNLYAISKTIEAMRGIERWGCSELLQRAFTGFKALTDGSKREWWDVLCCGQTSSQDHIKACYRHLVKKYHPDNPDTANEEMFRTVQWAYETAMKNFN